jgi:hypothetical protein
MSLPRLDHNGTFSPDDLGGLRTEFDAWCGRDRGVCTGPVARPIDDEVLVGNTPLSLRPMLRSVRPNTVAEASEPRGIAIRNQGRSTAPTRVLARVAS